MKIFKSSVILTAIAGLVMTSCGGSSYDKKHVEFVQQSGAAAFTLKGSADIYQRQTDLVYYDSVNMLMPSTIHNYNITALLDSIESVAFDTIGANTNGFIDTYLAKAASRLDFETVKIADTDSARMNCDGFEFVTGSAANLTSDYLGYCVTNEYYTPGAAHGMTTRYYINYDIENGKVFTAADIFTPEGLKSLPDLIIKRAHEMASFTGPVSITDLPSRNNFYLSSNGEIVFVYQPYEAASYSQGFINVPFYPYELIDQMTDYGLKYFKLDDLYKN